MGTSDDYYGAGEDAKRMERWKVEQLEKEFKNRLFARIRKGDVKQQSATQYASAVLGRPVKFLDELSEADFSNLMLALNGGKRSV